MGATAFLFRRVLAWQGEQVKPSIWGMFPGEKEIVMTPLRQKMLDAMIVRGLAQGGVRNSVCEAVF
jgi:hypothetical protein